MHFTLQIDLIFRMGERALKLYDNLELTSLFPKALSTFPASSPTVHNLSYDLGTTNHALTLHHTTEGLGLPLTGPYPPLG